MADGRVLKTDGQLSNRIQLPIESLVIGHGHCSGALSLDVDNIRGSEHRMLSVALEDYACTKARQLIVYPSGLAQRYQCGEAQWCTAAIAELHKDYFSNNSMSHAIEMP